VYSGIHYDAATLSPIKDAPPDFHQTVFPIVSSVRRSPIQYVLMHIKLSGDNTDPILVAATKLADILRQKKAFTNTATFDLKCEVCGT
jgi:ubiquitin thioesterase OTU1